MREVRIERTDGKTISFESNYEYISNYIERLRDKEDFIQVGDIVIRKTLIDMIHIVDVPETSNGEEKAE